MDLKKCYANANDIEEIFKASISNEKSHISKLLPILPLHISKGYGNLKKNEDFINPISTTYLFSSKGEGKRGNS